MGGAEMSGGVSATGVGARCGLAWPSRAWAVAVAGSAAAAIVAHQRKGVVSPWWSAGLLVVMFTLSIAHSRRWTQQVKTRINFWSTDSWCSASFSVEEFCFR